jgi:hypothetical protein
MQLTVIKALRTLSAVSGPLYVAGKGIEHGAIWDFGLRIANLQISYWILTTGTDY